MLKNYVNSLTLVLGDGSSLMTGFQFVKKVMYN